MVDMGREKMKRQCKMESDRCMFGYYYFTLKVSHILHFESTLSDSFNLINFRKSKYGFMETIEQHNTQHSIIPVIHIFPPSTKFYNKYNLTLVFYRDSINSKRGYLIKKFGKFV